ncbi:CGNR zinc finger domain-containing protein [Gellertiella hungarica]|nr:CGNR zinc finger domain-containing protein [Gellertiella hungarica]
MSFTWTPHRFVGGALAFDIANSVILRHLPERRLDRLADPANLAALPQAASAHSAERASFGVLHPLSPQDAPQLLALREAIDRYFRARAEGREDDRLLADLLEEIAGAIRRDPAKGDLIASTARSALMLISSPAADRTKVCGHCGWLFIDRSKNRSRLWCDMAICGNREKASRHYAARRGKPAGDDTEEKP